MAKLGQVSRLFRSSLPPRLLEKERFADRRDASRR